MPVNTISRGIAETIVILKPRNRFSSNTSPFYLLLLPPHSSLLWVFGISPYRIGKIFPQGRKLVWMWRIPWLYRSNEKYSPPRRGEVYLAGKWNFIVSGNLDLALGIKRRMTPMVRRFRQVLNYASKETRNFHGNT